MEENSLLKKWKRNYEYRTISNSMLSSGITVLFARYNGILGMKYGIIWNECICVYYCLLAVLRILVSLSAAKSDEKNITDKNRIYMISPVILILLIISLVGPLALMVMNKKHVSMTMIPAISMAAYTTYKVVMASVNLKRVQRTKDVLLIQLRNINFIDAIVSVLTIQNTLLVVNSSADRQDMIILSAISSVVGLGMILFLTTWNIIKSRMQ